MIMGVGRGDSAVRYVGRKPMKVADFEEALKMVKPFMNGKEVTWNDKQLQLKWVRPELPRIPMYVAGYGPKALRLAGRVGDGVIFQVADPFFIEWGMQFVRAGAEEAGRDPDDIVIHCAAATYVSEDRDEARNRVRWFPALIANHIVDVLRHHDPSVMPSYITEYVEARPGYDYYEHGQPGADHSKDVPDEICDKFCVIGTADECAEKVRELASIGVSEFNIYPLPDLEEIIGIYGREIVPHVRATGVA
jgi:alkanesulfonate monooxygenase SsuD/methylene tetrahydromethanopterin reductase-like flavin-dependent oxidoreductase (luciferase family)